jgi:hypothetical protein
VYQQKFSQKFSRKLKFSRNEISQKVSKFSLIFAFRKNENGFLLQPYVIAHGNK